MPSPAEEWTRQREAKIMDAIGKDRELKAFFDSIKNPHFNPQAITNFVDSWNKSHLEFSKTDLSSSVQKTYEAAGNATITIWVSPDGKVRLMANN
jgi:hypothetical protein